MRQTDVIRYILHPLLVASAVALMILSAYLFMDVSDDGRRELAALAVLCVGILSVYATLLIQGEPDIVWLADDADRVRVFWPPLLLGVVCLLLLAEVSGNVLDQPYHLRTTDHLQFGLLVLSVLLVAWGGAGRWHTWRRRLRLDWSLAGLIVVMVLGLAVRAWKLETAVHYFVDEINFGGSVVYAAENDFVPLLAPFHAIAAFPYVYPYWQSLTVDLFGWTLTAMRSVSVVIGVLTIPAVYLLGRMLFDRWTGLLAALLLATFPPHIHFSRLGINNVADVLVGTLLLAFLAHGLKHRQQVDFALAGVMLGLSQYFYEGGRVLYPLLVVVFLASILGLRRIQPVGLPLVRRLVLMLTVGFIVAMPVYYTLMALDKPFLHRFDTTGIGGSYHQRQVKNQSEQALVEHITWPLRIYVNMPERSTFYGGETALVLAVAVPFFFLGIGYAVWQWRDPGLLLLLLWVLATSAGSMVLSTSAYAARYVVVFPALMLLVAIGLRYLTTLPLLSPQIVYSLMGLALAFVQVDYYFNTHLDVYNRQLRPNLDIQDAVFRTVGLPPQTQICVVVTAPVSEWFYRGIQHYLTQRSDLCFLDRQMVSPAAIEALSQDRWLALFYNRYDEQTADAIEQAAVQVFGPFYSPFETVPDESQYVLYYTKAE